MLNPLPKFVLLAFIVGLIGCSSEREIQKVKFDSVKWKKTVGYNEHGRSAMVDDLVKSKKVIGLTKPQIVELLGETNELHHLEEFDMTYLVGRDRGYGIDFEFIGIRFDENGKADEVEVVLR